MVSKLDLYRVFWMVGREKSFSKAAKGLYMTQPAVSQSIKQLETELGLRLFHRTPRGATLTDEGSLLFEYVHSSLKLINVGEEKMQEFKNLTAGELKIGVGDTISKYFLLPYLEYFHNSYPKIKFRIFNGTTTEILNRLKIGEVDIALCNLPVDEPDVLQIPCMEVQDIFVCGEKYKKIASKPISNRELLKLPLIFLEQTSNSRKYVENFFHAKGIQLAPEFELGSYDLLLDFAKINLGIACVIKEFSYDYLSKGLVYEVKLKEPIPKRQIGICYLKDVSLSLTAKKFVDIVESGIKQKERTRS